MLKKMVINLVVVFIAIFIFDVTSHAGFLDNLIDKAVDNATGKQKTTDRKENATKKTVTASAYHCPPNLDALEPGAFRDNWKEKYPDNFRKSEYNDFVSFFQVFGSINHLKTWVESFSKKYPDHTDVPEMSCLKKLVEGKIAAMHAEKEDEEKREKAEAHKWEKIAEERQAKRDAEEAKIEAERERKAEEARKKEEKERKQREALHKRLLPKCSGKILDLGVFVNGINPFRDKGQCVEFIAISFQMTSATAGLFKNLDDIYFIEFSQSFRGGPVQGIAKIKGTYNYTTKIGAKNQVPHLKVLYLEDFMK